METFGLFLTNHNRIMVSFLNISMDIICVSCYLVPHCVLSNSVKDKYPFGAPSRYCGVHVQVHAFDPMRKLCSRSFPEL